MEIFSMKRVKISKYYMVIFRKTILNINHNKCLSN